METTPNLQPNPRRENLSGEYDSRSVSLKFTMLSPEMKAVLDQALNNAGLELTQCSNFNFLETLTKEQRKNLSSLIGYLYISKKDQKSQKETAKSIAEVLNS